ncbi:hypothetical protein QNO08_17010 [Arthrobacter sp. zg-Y820]|uniref:hypothetical protein n=1 Tax=unclassified Arthrobacter TaxID=235627 RepID=UPI001E47CC6E|nr:MULTISPECIES: hypothetical protein [unclassified Arthrobacter]MCC9197339.1 hypothetical protein [Arthrobacter sp. zg-Y820]MDK1280204.1 hypothetical protein [Arthrobacter sp. zg.Y820]MDK1360660.1 hypothetical protein [Arthrobacter sp. zg-Y1219]WIB09495.1 hypothetical protein QNO08_17010 [Arthrobacter sp. zg-Y820]
MTEHLNNHHRDTLDQILRHPTSSNIEWKNVVSLLEAVADTTREHNGKYEVTLGGQTDFLEPPRGKDIDEQTVVDLRKMLTRAGYTLDTK